MKYVTMGLKREVSLVILPIDDFTGRVITGSAVRMYTEDGKPSIRKDEGYHVFCDLKVPEIRIFAEGPLYQRQTLTFSLTGGVQIRQIRMLPGWSYPIPSGATCLKGTLPAGSRLRLYFPDQKKGYKLLYDYDPQKEGKKIRLFCPEHIRLDGKLLCIPDKKNAPEFFRILSWQNEEGELEAPLGQIYKKIGTTIFPVYEAEAGEDGKIYLLIQNLPEEGRACIWAESAGEEKKTVWTELVLEAGRENRITPEIFG